MKFEIQGKLPSMNEIITAAKSHYGAYSTMKRKYTEEIAWLAKKLPQYNKINISIVWYEQNAKRDPDGIISGGLKFIMDGLVQAKTIKDDSRKYIRKISNEFEIDKKNPRIEITIEESDYENGTINI